MAPRKNSALHAVKDDEVPPTAAEIPPHVPSVSEAAKSGDMRSLLVAMRDKIAETIEAGCPARELASLTRRLELIAREIASIDAQRDAEKRNGNGDPNEGEEPDPEWDESSI
jgi:hypothetical protein